MRAPVSWLREYADLPADLPPAELAEALTRVGLQVETIDEVGAEVTGPLVVGRVLRYADEPQKNGKVIRWVQVDVGPEHNRPHADFPQGCREVVCGAHNFVVGDLVVVSLPGTTLAGGFTISARKTYGHLSDGMICAEDELGIGHDHTGIIVLTGEDVAPGDDPAGVLCLRDTVLDIDVSPDMGYCLSIRGLAREAAGAFGVAFHDPVRLETPAAKADGYPVRLSDAGCPLFVALGVDGIDPAAKSPRWMARRLALCGMRSISLAVDVTNYVMLEIGQPLHGYDRDRLRGPIVVRKAEPGEKMTTLDDVERQLHPDDLLIADDSGPIGMAGVMGGMTTELSQGTVNVLIEAAHFDSHSIGWTLRRHSLPSEASKRFHRGVDPAAAYSAAHRAASLLVELASGRLNPAETVAGAVPAMPAQTIPGDLPAAILGVAVSADEASAILRRNGVAVREAEGSSLELLPPTWRSDLVDPYDYVEEVGRKIGFDTIPSVVPPAPAGGGFTWPQRARRAVAKAVVDAGFTEVITFPFLSEADLDQLGVPADDARRQLVRLANPLAETAPNMRSTLLPGLFAAVARNTSRGNDDLALFEAGSVFLRRSDSPAPLPGVDGPPSDDELAAIAAAMPAQPRHLAAVLTGWWRRPGWDGPGDPADWRHAFAFADAAAGALGASIVRAAAEHAPFHPGRCAELCLSSGEVVGHAGELHPSVVEAFGLPARSAAVEIDLDALVAAAPGPGSIPPVSGHPVAKEDVAVVVGADVPAQLVEDALRDGAGQLLESIWLFDRFTGGSLPEGKKSLAYALRFRAADRTLTDEETAGAKAAAVALAQERCGAVLRAF